MAMTNKDIARGYDEIAERIGMSQPFYETLLRFAGPAKTPLLDVGCGQGLLLEQLEKQQGLDSGLFGVDISPKLCALARERTHATIQEADATALPFPDNHFRTVFSTEVLEHIVEPTKMLNEIHRVLTADGRCCLTMPNRDWPRYERYQKKRVQFQPVDDHFFRLAEIRELAARSGFVVAAAGGYGSIWHGGWLGKMELGLAAFVPSLRTRRKRLFVALTKDPQC